MIYPGHNTLWKVFPPEDMNCHLIGNVVTVVDGQYWINYAEYISKSEMEQIIMEMYEEHKGKWNEFLKPSGIAVEIQYQGNIVYTSKVILNE